MIRNTLAACLASMLLAAHSVAWDVVPGSGAGDCNFTKYGICFQDFDADENSPVIDTRMCENWSLFFDSDIGATTTDTTANVRLSIASTASANTSWIVENKLLNGDEAAATASLRGFDSPWLYVDIVTYSAGDTARAALMCFPRSRY